MTWREFLENWQVEKYLEENKDIDEVKEKFNEYNKMKSEGYIPLHLRLLGNEPEISQFYDKPFYHATRYAYTTNNYGKSYANIIVVFAKETTKKDVNGEKIYLTPDNSYFIIHRVAGDPSSFGKLSLNSPS